MNEYEFAEVFSACVSGSLPTGWTITPLDIGEILVKADHGRSFRLCIIIEDQED